MIDLSHLGKRTNHSLMTSIITTHVKNTLDENNDLGHWLYLCTCLNIYSIMTGICQHLHTKNR